MGVEIRPAGRRRWLVPVGTALVVAGIMGVVLALTILAWFDFSNPGVFRDVRGARDFANSPYGPRFMRDYAQWIGWSLLAATIVSGLGAVRFRRGRVALRAIAVVVGLLGATASVLNLVSMANNSYGDWHQVLGHMSVGIPAATFGFVLLTVGLAVVSARSRRSVAQSAT